MKFIDLTFSTVLIFTRKNLKIKTYKIQTDIVPYGETESQRIFYPKKLSIYLGRLANRKILNIPIILKVPAHYL